MPEDETREDLPEVQEERPKREDKPKPKKKKGPSKLRRLLLMSLLLLGVALGLHFSGAVDMRGPMFRAVYSIPKVGPSLGAALGIPATYAMSSQERRAMEIRQMEEALSALKAELDRRGAELDAASADLSARQGEIAKLEAQLQAKLKELEAEDDKKEQASLASLEDVLKTYKDMSPRNAAQIIGKMNEDLAVEILSRLPKDQAAKILGRMDADLAARLTERLANVEKRP